jgi:hypothetical protein
MEENTRIYVASILTKKMTGVCDKDFILTLQNLPPEITVIEVDIVRNNKTTYARTSLNPPF